MNFATYFTDISIQQHSANNDSDILISSQTDDLLWLPQEDIISSPKHLNNQNFDNFPYPDSFSSSEPSSDLLLPTEKSSESYDSLYEPESSQKVTTDSKSKKISKGTAPKSTSAQTPSPKSAKRNLWTSQEDAQVVELVKKFGTKWAIVASNMKNRNGKQVRDRYINYLLPNIKTDIWTEQEDQLLINLTYEHGNKWKLISTFIPGRTENQVKSRYYTHLKKRAEDGKSDYVRNAQAGKVVAKSQPTSTMNKMTSQHFVFPAPSASNNILSNDKQVESVYPQWTHNNIEFQAAQCSDDVQFNRNMRELVGKLDTELLQFVDVEQPSYNLVESPKQERFSTLKSRKAALEMVLAQTHAEIQDLEMELNNDEELSAFLDYWDPLYERFMFSLRIHSCLVKDRKQKLNKD